MDGRAADDEAMSALEKSRMLRDHSAVMVGPLLLTGVSLGSTASAAPVLVLTAIAILVAVTANRIRWKMGALSLPEEPAAER